MKDDRLYLITHHGVYRADRGVHRRRKRRVLRRPQDAGCRRPQSANARRIDHAPFGGRQAEPTGRRLAGPSQDSATSLSTTIWGSMQNGSGTRCGNSDLVRAAHVRLVQRENSRQAAKGDISDSQCAAPPPPQPPTGSPAAVSRRHAGSKSVCSGGSATTANHTTPPRSPPIRQRYSACPAEFLPR